MTINVIPIKRLPRGLTSIFTYFVPPSLENEIKIRQVVKVPFKNKDINAVIIGANQQGNKIKLIKTLSHIITPFPFITINQLRLVEFISQSNFVSLPTAMLSFIKGLPIKIPELNIKLKTSNQRTQSNTLWTDNSEIIKELIQKVDIKNKQILYLVPEHEQVKELADQSSAIHWRKTLSKKVFLKDWLSVLQGETNFIVGTRSVLFAPFINLDLIIMTNDFNDSYKSEQTPRFHAREVAEKLAQIHKAKLVYYSTSPSLEVYSTINYSKPTLNQPTQDNKKNKKLIQNNLKLIDLKQERENENYSSLSSQLQDAIKIAISENKQIFLFLNRKGDATSINCQECGFFIKCPECHLPKVYHSTGNYLICHHCRHKEDLPPLCPKCSKDSLKLSGRGTQKLEREIKQIFPKTKILRIDKDNDTAKYNFETSDFKIIIGTEFALTRILLSHIHIIGIINADVGFYRPDFRTSERQYQLLNKIIFSAKNSQIFLQTYNPKSHIIQAITQNNSEVFYKEELSLRKALNYPPYKKIIKLIYKHKDEKKAVGEAMHIYHRLRKHLLNNDETKIENLEIIKPFPVFERITHGKLQFNLIIKYHPQDNSKISTKLNELVPHGWVFDRDPETLL